MCYFGQDYILCMCKFSFILKYCILSTSSRKNKGHENESSILFLNWLIMLQHMPLSNFGMFVIFN